MGFLFSMDREVIVAFARVLRFGSNVIFGNRFSTRSVLVFLI